MRNLLFAILIGVTLVSCQQVKKPNSTEFILPDNAMSITYRGHIYVESTVDSILGMYVFDTGASNFYFDSVFYHSNGYSYENVISGILPGAGTKPQRVEVIMDTVNIDLNGNSYRTKVVPVLKLKPILGDFADGILGMEYFYKSALKIDYLNEYMCMYHSIDSLDVSDYKKVKLSMIDNRLYIELGVQVTDSLEIQGDFLIDLGCGGSIVFTNATVEKYKLNELINSKVAYYTKYGGVGGESKSYHFKAFAVNIADCNINDVTVDYSMDKKGALSDRKHLGLLGNDILEKFDVVIDFLNLNLYLKPNENYSDKFEFSRLSFGYVDRQKTKKAWIVTGLYKGANAETAGLQIDDKILAVNGKSIVEIPYKEQERFFDNIQRVDLLVLRDDKKINISFDLNFVL